MPAIPDPIDTTPIITNWIGGRTLDYVGLLNDRPAYTYGDERIYWNGTIWGLYNIATGPDVLYYSSSQDVFYPWEVTSWSPELAPDGTYIVNGQTITVQLFIPPTATPTSTPVEPTATPVVPTATPIEPTSTPVVPTATPVIPTSTPVEMTSTPTPTLTPVPTPTPFNNSVVSYIIMPGTYDHSQAYTLPNNTQASIYLNLYFDPAKPIGIFTAATGAQLTVPSGEYNKAIFIRDSEFLPGQDGIISVTAGDSLTFRSIIILGSQPPPTPTPVPTPQPTPRPVLPPGYANRGGTTYNASVETYEDLSNRIQRQLGAPLINLEISDDQIYDNITDSIEYFTKWAGYTEEYLVFDSKLYLPGVGIKVDSLINKTSEMRNSRTPGLSAGYDYDLASWRKVVDCFEFSKGEDTGINTLFTMEQAMAQQIYSSYMIGNFGFDLVTWEVLKGFIDTRNKVLAMQSQFRFDPRSQVLRLIPEPQSNHTFLGIVGCYIERPIKDLIKERWVQKYALALSKIAIARVREKFSGTNMFGGGQVNSQTLLAEGIKEKETLEQELMNSYQDNMPPTFFIG